VYNYDRSIPMAGLVAFFVQILALIGKRKGLDACLAILFTLVFILCVVLPALYNGHSAMLMGLLTALLSTAVTLILLHGPTKQCLLGVAATLLGELAACLLFAICSGSFHLTGFQTDEAEGLLLIAQSTGLDIRTLLFAAVMISSVGAVMDVAVSILSALREVALASKSPESKALFHSGINLGRDMIGTMGNTLIFAFTGGALTTMLVFFSYGIQFHQLLSSDYLTVELAQGLCSTAAVILTVPVASAMGAAFYGQKHKR
ncbi:MAG: YibE/F family protein, partial [Firmicutes bacterium]|nr:YibE/F family protein [Bacillota bacterium]